MYDSTQHTTQVEREVGFKHLRAQTMSSGDGAAALCTARNWLQTINSKITIHHLCAFNIH